MKIAIVDDCSNERRTLRNYLEHQLARRSIGAQIQEFCRGEDFLKSAEAEKQPFEIVFLDIYMNEMNGIETARRLRTFDKKCLLIFATTSEDHALEGFQVRAMHYLVKPYAESEVDALMDEIVARIPQPDSYLSIKANGTDVNLPFREIIYAEHFSHRIHIHTCSKETLSIRQSFRDFTASLKSDSRFFLCSRGVVINMDHAIDFDGTAFILKSGEAVSVSRDLQKPARQSFMNYLFQKGSNL